MSFSVLHNIIKEADGSFRVNFGVTGQLPAGLKGRVSVSRRPDHSFYTIENIADHAGRGPAFSTLEDARKLVARVESDIAAILKGTDPSTNASYTGRGAVAPRTAAPPAPTTVAVNKPPVANGAVVGTNSKLF